MNASLELSKLPSNWKVLPFLDVFNDVTSKGIKVKKENYDPVGKLPVVDQGKKLFGGFTDIENKVDIKLPVIIFGDHTKIFKLIDTEFAVGADGVKLLEPKIEADKKFLYFYLNQLQLEDAGYSRHFKFLKEIYIPLPPLDTQKKIAAVLEKADQLRKDCQQMEQELNNLAQSVFIDMFGDPLSNPKGWRLRTLNEFYASKKTGTKCGPFGSALKKEEFVGSGIPVWNMSNISLTGEFIDKPELWITEDKYKNLESYNVISGDVIISRAGTVGKMGVVVTEYDKSIISTNLIRVRFGKELLPLYFVCLMTYCKTRLKRLKVGDDGSFSHMSTGVLDKLEFPYPPMKEQLKYISFRKKLDLQINDLNKLRIEQDSNFNALMQKAFKGELNLTDAPH